MDEDDQDFGSKRWRPRSRWFMSDMKNFSFFRLQDYFRSYIMMNDDWYYFLENTLSTQLVIFIYDLYVVHDYNFCFSEHGNDVMT